MCLPISVQDTPMTLTGKNPQLGKFFSLIGEIKRPNWTIQNLLPVGAKFVAHGIEIRCPSFFKTMGNVFEKDGQRFPKLRATKKVLSIEKCVHLPRIMDLALRK